MSDLRISGSSAYQSQIAMPSVGGAAKTEEVSSSVPEEQEDTPTLMEQMLEAREKARKTREKFQLPKTNRRYGDAAIEAHARLARARNAAQVSAAAGYASRQIIRLKAAKKQDLDHARQIQGAINQLQKAVNRAGKKRKDLAGEELAEKRRKKLMEEEQLRKARQLSQQLKSRKTMRSLRESGYVREAEVSQRVHAQWDAADAALREQFQAVSDAAASAQDAAITCYAAQAASLETQPVSSAITVQA